MITFKYFYYSHILDSTYSRSKERTSQKSKIYLCNDYPQPSITFNIEDDHVRRNSTLRRVRISFIIASAVCCCSVSSIHSNRNNKTMHFELGGNQNAHPHIFDTFERREHDEL